MTTWVLTADAQSDWLVWYDVGGCVGGAYFDVRSWGVAEVNVLELYVSPDEVRLVAGLRVAVDDGIL